MRYTGTPPPSLELVSFSKLKMNEGIFIPDVLVHEQYVKKNAC
jgi:hypothetical protein